MNALPAETLSITLVPHGYLHKALPDMVHLMQKSEDWSHGRSNIDDIMGFLFAGQMQLWMMYNPDNWTPHAFVVSEIKTYPRKKLLTVQYCAGDIGAAPMVGHDMFATLESYARDAGCDGIEILGRKGWQAYVKHHGYTADTVLYEKFFGEQP